MSFLTNQLIRRNKKQKVYIYIYIYIYIYGNLINCEYFNNLNRTKIWWGQVLWRGYVHSYTQLKMSVISHIHIQSMQDSPSKWRRVQTILTWANLFVISSYDILLHVFTTCFHTSNNMQGPGKIGIQGFSLLRLQEFKVFA